MGSFGKIVCDKDGKYNCPITAVAKKKTGTNFYPGDYLNAANAISLDEEIADKIATAADYSVDGYNYDQRYRNKLEKILGIKK